MKRLETGDWFLRCIQINVKKKNKHENKENKCYELLLMFK